MGNFITSNYTGGVVWDYLYTASVQERLAVSFLFLMKGIV